MALKRPNLRGNELPVSPDWILRSGYWNDVGVWVDGDVWNDGPTYWTNQFIDTIPLLKPKQQVTDITPLFVKQPQIGLSLQSFFDQVQLRRSIIVDNPILQPISIPTVPIAPYFDTVKLKQPVIDANPILFQPAVTVTVNFTLDPFFEIVRLKQPIEVLSGPFAGTSPPLTIPYITREFFDTVRLKPPIISVPDNLPQVVTPTVFSLSNWFDVVRPKTVLDRLQESFGAPALPRPSLTAWFEPIRLKSLVIDTPQLSSRPFAVSYTTAWFDPYRRITQTPEPFQFIPTVTKVNTIQNALTPWFETTKLLQLRIDPPVVVYYPAQFIPTVKLIQRTLTGTGQ